MTILINFVGAGHARDSRAWPAPTSLFFLTNARLKRALFANKYFRRMNGSGSQCDGYNQLKTYQR